MSTTATLRPDTPILTSGSAVIGPGNLAETLADDTDATYAETLGPFTKNRVRFESFAVPSGALIYSVVLRLRSMDPAPGTTDIVPASLNLRVGMTFNPGNNVFTTSSSVPQPLFTPAEVAFGISLDWSSTGSSRLSEAYLDVVYVEAPTVDVTAPTGTIATTQPTIEWDTSGDYAQSNWQVKIFTQAQFESPGFSPTASSAFWDSGVQAGNVQTHGGFHSHLVVAGGSGSITPPQNLANGGTYRYYVRAAQRVGSITQWSAWNFEEITVTATPPDAPTLTVDADGANARIKLTVTEADPWEFVTIERTADGTTWEPVRSATRAAVFGATFVAYDYESGNGQDVQYRALAIATVGDSDVASDWSTSTAPTSWTSTVIWLKAPMTPTLNSVVVVQDIPTLTRRLPQGAFDVGGRSDPVVVSDVRHLTEGTVTFVALDDAALAALLALLDQVAVLLLQTPAISGWGSRYIAISDVAEDRVSGDSTEQTRLVVCPFVEVLAPVGGVVGFGVTWDDIIDLYADWDAVLDANVSWFELLEA